MPVFAANNLVWYNNDKGQTLRNLGQAKAFRQKIATIYARGRFVCYGHNETIYLQHTIFIQPETLCIFGTYYLGIKTMVYWRTSGLFSTWKSERPSLRGRTKLSIMKVFL